MTALYNTVSISIAWHQSYMAVIQSGQTGRRIDCETEWYPDVAWNGTTGFEVGIEEWRSFIMQLSDIIRHWPTDDTM